MKNTKKVMACVLALTLLLSMFSFSASAASFTDVEDTASYAEAVEILAALDLLAGYPDGTFKPEGDITRAEFAAVVCRALGLEAASKGAVGATKFTDVAADHWASGYINMAAQRGYVAGYGDGTFGPDNNITYEQAIKLVVAALGYTPLANQTGGYPSGYLAIAAQKGILDGVSGANGQNATRALVSQLLYNALEVPLMVISGTTLTGQPAYSEDANSSILKTYLKVTRVVGIVSGNDYATSVKAADKKVMINTVDATGTVSATATPYYINGTNAADFLGQQVTAYAKDVNNRSSIVAIAAKSGRNTVVTLDKPANIVGKTSDTVFEYWLNKDTDTRTQKLTLSTTMKVFLNGMLETASASAVVNNLKPSCGNVAFIDNNNDSIYDYALIEDYYDIVVDTVSSKGKVFDKGVNGSVTFDPEDTTVQYQLLLDGEEIEAADLQTNDVISIFKTSNSLMIKGIVTRDSVVTGKVTGVTNQSPIEYKIDGVPYQISPSVTLGTIKSGDEGTFFLNKDGYIAYKDGKTGIARNYGYILKSAKSTGISDTTQVLMMDTSGAWKTYNVASTLNYTAINATRATSYKASEITDAIRSALKEKAVAYKLNDKGEIREITVLQSALQAGSQDASEITYKKSTNIIKNRLLVDDAVIFTVNGTEGSIRQSDVSTMPVSSLIDDENYEAVLFVNEDSDIVAMLLKGTSTSMPLDADLFVVTSTGTDVTDYGDAYSITGYVAGSDTQETYITAEDYDVEVINGYANNEFTKTTGTFSDVQPGAIVTLAVNANNEVTRVRVVYDGSNIDLSGNDKYYNGTIPGATSAKPATYVIGEVYNKTTTSIGIGRIGATVTGAPADFAIDTFRVREANFSLYDYSTDRGYASDFGDVERYLSSTDRGSIVLIKTYDDAVQSVVILEF